MVKEFYIKLAIRTKSFEALDVVERVAIEDPELHGYEFDELIEFISIKRENLINEAIK